MAGLQAFEAAARHLSFTVAAEELHVTQGAVSRRIRQLEDSLKVALFVRMTRRIELTPAGREFFVSVSRLLAEFVDAADSLGQHERRRSLTVSSLPTVASEWLMPRLHEFTQRRGHVDVRILTSIEPADFGAQGLHAAIRVGQMPGRRYPADGLRIDLQMTTDWAGLHADHLFADRMLPVCTPSLLGARRDALLPEEFPRYPLVHTTTRRHAWSDWLRKQGVREVPSRDKTLEFGHFFMSLQAARKGRGIALIPDIVLAHASLDGLICPRHPDVASAGDYCLLIPAKELNDPVVVSFRRWLLREARRARRTIQSRFTGTSFSY